VLFVHALLAVAGPCGEVAAEKIPDGVVLLHNRRVAWETRRMAAAHDVLAPWPGEDEAVRVDGVWEIDR